MIKYGLDGAERPKGEKMKKLFKKFKESGLLGKVILSLICGSAVGFILFYIFLPPINLQSVGFWLYLTVVIACYSLPFLGIKVNEYVEITKRASGTKKKKNKIDVKYNKWALVAVAIPVTVIILGLLISSEIFNAHAYARVIEVTESSFTDDLPESSEVTNIALMDTQSAAALGNKELGSLADMVSQFVLSDYYTQINYKRTPKKVSNLEYDGFFKWIGNRDSGIPGAVLVDPVKNDAEYLQFDEPMIYVESGYFGDDLERKLRFEYPTKIFDSITFELDEEGNPYYIVSCSRPQVALFGASDVEEVIIFDPTDGSSEIMAVENAPAWIDVVYTGDLASTKYNWHGTLSGGFFNSIIGNVGCKIATDDFGYIVIEDDVWYFTGVTSVVSNDLSNIGFILSNARTGEYKFYSVIGAEEHSAMAAAEGEVQEKGYEASFPSLINVAGQPTYIMVLKNAAGVVELYALVNVENYSLVATGNTQAEAMSSYKKLLRLNNVDTGASDKIATVTVENVRVATLSGISTVYITSTSGKVYKGYLETDEALMLIRVGDVLEVSYTEGEINGLYSISEWKFASSQ